MRAFLLKNGKPAGRLTDGVSRAHEGKLPFAPVFHERVSFLLMEKKWRVRIAQARNKGAFLQIEVMLIRLGFHRGRIEIPYLLQPVVL